MSRLPLRYAGETIKTGNRKGSILCFEDIPFLERLLYDEAMPKIIDHNKYRKELLQACVRIFANNSYGSLTMRQIAADLGVSTGTLYHYFASKEDLFVQLAEHIAVESLVVSESAVKKLDTLEERLDNFLNFIKGYEDQLMQTLLILTDFMRTAQAKGIAYDSRYTIELFKHVEWTANYLQVEDADLVHHFLMFIQGLVLQRYMDQKKTDIDHHMKVAKTMFLSSYRKPKETL